MAVQVSIVIRTRNEGATLGTVLEGINRQQFDPAPEVVVVDSGSTDNTLDVARRFGCRIVEIRREEFSWGGAINTGIRAACGDVIVLLSGHCEPVNDRWLCELVRPLDDQSVAATFGRQVPDPSVDPLEAIELQYLWFPPGNEPIQSKGFSNASCAIRRDVWRKAQFDEHLLSAEDGEWAQRVRAMGYKILYVPSSLVRHSHPPAADNIYRRWYWRSLTGVKIFPGCRDGGIAYLGYKTLKFVWLDLRYLARVGRLSAAWRIPFYELVRQWAAFRGARESAHHNLRGNWFDAPVPRWVAWIEPIVSGLYRPKQEDGER